MNAAVTAARSRQSNCGRKALQPEPGKGGPGIRLPRGQHHKLITLLLAVNIHRTTVFEIRGKCHSGSGTAVFLCVTDLQRSKEKTRTQESDYRTLRTGKGDRYIYKSNHLGAREQVTSPSSVMAVKPKDVGSLV